MTKVLTIVFALFFSLFTACSKSDKTNSNNLSCFETESDHYKRVLLTKYKCSNTDVVVPEGVTVVSPSAFNHVELTSLTLPHSLEDLCNSSDWDEDTVDFQKQQKLNTIVVPDTVFYFVSCYKKKKEKDGLFFSGVPFSGEVPSGINSKSKKTLSKYFPVGAKVIRHSELKKETKSSDLSCFNVVNGKLLSYRASDLCGGGDLILPEGIESIGQGAFRGLHVSSVGIPEGVTEIEKFAFQNTGLRNVTFPESLKKIGAYAFSGNTLTSVILPDSVREIGEGTFYDNELTYIRLSENLTSIEQDTFNRNHLKKISIPKNIDKIDNCAFFGNELDIHTDIDQKLLHGYILHCEVTVVPGEVRGWGY